MKNYSREFWLKNWYITVGTHWKDWALPLRIYWLGSDFISHSIDIFIDILCFTICIEIYTKRGKNENQKL